MKILQIIPLLVPGGAERFVVELSDELVRQGYDCSILTFYAFEEKVNLKVQDGVQHDIILKRKGFDPVLMFKVYNYIKKNRFDVVHVHVSAIKYILLASFLLPKVKFVATIHSEATREAGRSIDKWSRKLMFKFNRCTPVTISEESLASFEKFYGRTAPMVYNGVAEKKTRNIGLRDNEEQVVFVHVASCQPVKNQELLFNAFNQIIKAFSNTKLIWIGSLSSYSDLFNQLKDNFGSTIEYHGIVENVRDYLYSSDALCLSSKMEGMPMSIIEAFSVGCIPLSTPVGGCVNMIENGVNGFLSHDLSVESYSNMLLAFCNSSKDDRYLLSQNALSSFAKYSITKCAEQYIEIYKQ